MVSTQNSTADFQVSKSRKNIFLSFSALSRLFPRTFLIRNVAFTPWRKASALRKFEMVIKQPTWATFHFKISSKD